MCVRWCASSGILGGDFGNSVYALSVWPVKRGFTRGEYDEATVQHEAAMEKNRAEIAKEKENLIEAQKQVSEFKKSLFDMYKTHLEMISAMPEIELDEEDTSQYSEQTETTEEELPQPDPFATSSFSARTIKGVYESRFTDLQFGQNNSHTGNTTTTEKEEV